MRLDTWLLIFVAHIWSAPVMADSTADVPLVLESPGCEHEKRGSIEIEVGERVTEGTEDPNVPPVDYRRVLQRLTDAARQRGANAVVLRLHQAVYFTRNGKQSRGPIYVKLRAAAIHIPDPAQCVLQPVYAADLEARSRTRAPDKAYAKDVFNGD